MERIWNRKEKEMTRVIDGKALALKLQEELAEKTARLREKTGQVPGLVVILVGENPASQVYVRNKERSALAAGFRSEVVRLAESTSQEELLALMVFWSSCLYQHISMMRLSY